MTWKSNKFVSLKKEERTTKCTESRTSRATVDITGCPSQAVATLPPNDQRCKGRNPKGTALPTAPSVSVFLISRIENSSRKHVPDNALWELSVNARITHSLPPGARFVNRLQAGNGEKSTAEPDAVEHHGGTFLRSRLVNGG